MIPLAQNVLELSPPAQHVIQESSCTMVSARMPVRMEQLSQELVPVLTVTLTARRAQVHLQHAKAALLASSFTKTSVSQVVLLGPPSRTTVSVSIVILRVIRAKPPQVLVQVVLATYISITINV